MNGLTTILRKGDRVAVRTSLQRKVLFGAVIQVRKPLRGVRHYKVSWNLGNFGPGNFEHRSSYTALSGMESLLVGPDLELLEEKWAASILAQ